MDYTTARGLSGGLTPFVFYKPFASCSGRQINSNYDPTDIARTHVPELELLEVAW